MLGVSIALAYRVSIAADGSIGAPTTLVVSGPAASLNAKFDSGFPPTADSFEVVIVDGR